MPVVFEKFMGLFQTSLDTNGLLAGFCYCMNKICLKTIKKCIGCQSQRYMITPFLVGGLYVETPLKTVDTLPSLILFKDPIIGFYL